ncbi:hypothetical protein V6N11_002655 [Hibiscus sabdariffa]|uniref:Uncharacterized protein n=1 Tax=Hibiscus sabdariffa TaxID=183260 RepID=A0ABR2SAU4_9ROSI
MKGRRVFSLAQREVVLSLLEGEQLEDTHKPIPRSSIQARPELNRLLLLAMEMTISTADGQVEMVNELGSGFRPQVMDSNISKISGQGVGKEKQQEACVKHMAHGTWED